MEIDIKKVKFTLKKEVGPAQYLPPFYGFAYWDYPRNIRVCYPLGINLIVILALDFHAWLKDPKRG